MSPKRKSTIPKVAGGGDSSMFGLTIAQLKSLMELRGKEMMEKLKSSEFNGVRGILEKLKVDGNKGLTSSNEQDLEQRRTAYGVNEIPPKPAKSFLSLCWEALCDMILGILMLCALVSFCLSFYHPPHPVGEPVSEERK
jgi:magnesium-transporting ATPase (P-type)